MGIDKDSGGGRVTEGTDGGNADALFLAVMNFFLITCYGSVVYVYFFRKIPKLMKGYLFVRLNFLSRVSQLILKINSIFVNMFCLPQTFDVKKQKYVVFGRMTTHILYTIGCKNCKNFF